MSVSGAKARQAALSLPETTHAPHFTMTAFAVRGKLFATLSAEGDFLNVFLADTDLETTLMMYPECVEKLFWGAKARGVRIILARAKQVDVSEILQLAWSRKAPKGLVSSDRAQQVEQSPSAKGGRKEVKR
jgi:hypothetical protein